MMMVVAPAPPNDTGNNPTGDENTANEKVVANEGSRRLFWGGFPGRVEPVIHAPCKVEKRSSLPTGRFLLHHPKT
jgi:hypothetical protein